jgi:ubiquinone/menaquinone biosynthesis C-methylase UbiE
MHSSERYIPALRYRFLTPFYDILLKRFMREDIFKKRLIDQAELSSGMRLLDLGCGTGTLTILVKQMHPQVEVTALDGDPQVLAIARKKVDQAGLNLSLDLGMAFELPYPDNNFDRVISSMVMHHLTGENKSRTLAEIRRVLKPAGEFHMVDFGVPDNVYARMTSTIMRRFEDVNDNIQGRLINYIRSAGFLQVELVGHSDTFFGTLSFYKAVK